MSVKSELTDLLEDSDFLKCPLCQSKLKNPVILSCLHTLCQNCYDGWKTNQQNGRRCPVCSERDTVHQGDSKTSEENGVLIADTNHFMVRLRKCEII